MGYMNLNSNNVEPLLPPGIKMEANQPRPVDKLVGDFHSWLKGRNHTLTAMQLCQIYDQLFELLGGKRTPANIRHVPLFHGVLNDAYHRIIGTLSNPSQGNGGVLLPPELNYKI